LQDIVGYTDEMMGQLYEVARGLFERQQYEEASEAFFFLSTLNASVYAYWLGLGMADQLQGEAEAALVAYGMASVVAPGEPLAHYHAAHCHREVGDEGEAARAMEYAEHCCGEEPEHADLKARARRFLPSC